MIIKLVKDVLTEEEKEYYKHNKLIPTGDTLEIIYKNGVGQTYVIFTGDIDFAPYGHCIEFEKSYKIGLFSKTMIIDKKSLEISYDI